MRPISLIFGITGQDGAYLSALLLSKGYEVFGTTRKLEKINEANLKILGIEKNVQIFETDILNNDFVRKIITEITPHEIYFLAGQSSAALSFQLPAETFTGIVSGTLNVLETIRLYLPQTRVFFAGSGDAFVDSNGLPVNEQTAFLPRNPYAVARVAAYWLVRNYRETYNLFACTGILFNHESPLRPARFVTRKIVETVKAIANGQEKEIRVGRLDIERDWGWAAEYVNAMHMMLQPDSPDDFVIATGQSMTLHQFIHEVFSYYNLTPEKYIVSDTSFYRSGETIKVKVSPEKISKVLGWKAKIYGKQLIDKMIKNEYF